MAEPTLLLVLGAIGGLLGGGAGVATLLNSRANRVLLRAQAESTSVGAAISLFQAVSKERDGCAERLARTEADLSSTKGRVLENEHRLASLAAAVAEKDEQLRRLREALEGFGVVMPPQPQPQPAGPARPRRGRRAGGGGK